MKVLPLILVSAVSGVAIGGALGYYSVGTVKVDPRKVVSQGPVEQEPSGVSKASPKARIDEPVFEFGVMQRGTTRSHEFVLYNDGDAPLVVAIGDSSCKCTVGEFDKGPIAPGSSAPVTLTWTATASTGAFRQTASLETNDPTQRHIVVTVDGDVVDVTGLMPREFSLGRFGPNETRQASVVLMTYETDDLRVTPEPPSREAVTGKFDVSTEDLSQEELPDPRAKAGVRVLLTAKPGLAIGTVNEAVTLKTNLPEAEELRVPVFGRVEGDLSIRGLNWSADSGVLGLGIVKSDRGKSEKLRVSIKGPHSASAKLEVAEVDPPELQVALGEPRQVREGIVHMPLTVEVPAGTRPMIRLQTGRKKDGTFLNPEGTILLKSSLPDTPEVLLRVRFAVEGGRS